MEGRAGVDSLAKGGEETSENHKTREKKDWMRNREIMLKLPHHGVSIAAIAQKSFEGDRNREFVEKKKKHFARWIA